MTTYPNETHLAPNLTRAEMRCHCGCTMPPAVAANINAFAPAWQAVRTAYGRPMVINCGYRCPRQNAVVGGAKASQHLHGLAADCRGERNLEIEAIAIAKAALAIPAIRGICVYDNAHGTFCHLDTRPGPRWLAVNGGKLAGDQEGRLRRWIAAGRVVP